MENRSKYLNSSSMHPHTLYPGIPHYLDDQRLSQISEIPYDDRTNDISTSDWDMPITGCRKVHNPPLLDNCRSFSAEITCSIDKKDH
jgi:hypothetical protein